MKLINAIQETLKFEKFYEMGKKVRQKSYKSANVCFLSKTGHFEAQYVPYY